MTLEHRKSSILNEILQSAVNALTDSLALKAQEVDALKKQVEELNQKLSPKADSSS